MIDLSRWDLKRLIEALDDAIYFEVNALAFGRDKKTRDRAKRRLAHYRYYRERFKMELEE